VTEIVAEGLGFELRKDGMSQSHVDLDDPTRLVFDYVRRIGDVLDVAAPAGEPLRVVHVGGAALTLPRYVAATRPRSAQIVLEPDEDLTALVRDRLPLPPRSGIKVRPQDGRAGLAALREDAADVLVLDAFADGRVPGELVTVEAFAQMRRVVAPGGLLVANLVDRAPFEHVRRALAALRQSWAEVLVSAEPATLRGRRQGNLIVVAGDSVPAQELGSRAGTGAAPYRLLTGTAVSDSLGGGRPFTDTDTVGGPEPERAR
jgi:SAM-dependent methyltransferase